MRVHKAEQYFNQTDTDCSINSCPELLRKGKKSQENHLSETLNNVKLRKLYHLLEAFSCL